MVANLDHEVAYKDLLILIGKHSNNLTPLELLAIASNLVGKLVALQDQRTITPADAMEVVARNVEQGNREVLETLLASSGGSA